MNTSHNGMFCVVMANSRRLFGSRRSLPASALFRVGERRLANPGAFVVRLAPRREPVAIARAVAGKHLIELVPGDRAVFPVRGCVLLHAGIWNGQAKELRLRHG